MRGAMANRNSPPPPPPKWQQVVVPKASPTPQPAEAEEPNVFVIPEDRLDDPREQVPWFGRLPDHAKEDLRERWRAQVGASGEQKERKKVTTQRWIAEAVALLALAEVVLQKPTPASFLIAAALGVPVGWAGARLKLGAIRYGFVAACAWLLFGAFAGSRHFAYYVISVLIVFCVAAAFGVSHRLDRFDATEL